MNEEKILLARLFFYPKRDCPIGILQAHSRIITCSESTVQLTLIKRHWNAEPSAEFAKESKVKPTCINLFFFLISSQVNRFSWTLQAVQHASVTLLQIPSKAFANFRENRELFAMANFDPIVGHFQALNKCFSKGQTQPPQEANCPRHTNEGAEVFELSSFLGLEQEFVNSCHSEDAGDQSCNLNTVKSGQGLERDYARPFPSDLPCFQENNLDLNSTVIQTHQPSETM